MTAGNEWLEGTNLEVIEGSDDHLFVRTFAGYDVASCYTDELAVPDRVVDAWAVTLAARRRQLARQGIVYLTVIVPDAHAVYPDRLPDGMTLVSRSPAQRLIDRLDDETAAQTLYLRDALVAGRERWETYQRVDSHWTDRGAWIGYLEVMRSLRASLPELPVLRVEDVEWVMRRSFGVLGSVVTPERSEQVEHGRLKEPRTKTAAEAVTEIRDGFKVFEQDDDGLPVAVVFRDSFMTQFAEQLAQSFRQTWYVTSPNSLYYDLIAHAQPKVVIHEICEHRIAWHHPREPSPNDFRAVFADLRLQDESAVAVERASRVAARAGETVKALDLNDQAIRIEGPTPRLLVRRAELLLVNGNTEAAIEAARHAASLDPFDGSPWSLLARAYESQGRRTEALDACCRAVAAEPDQPEYWGQAVSMALVSGQLDLAEQLVAEALERHPDHPTTAHAESYTRLAAGQLDAAAAASRRAVALDPVVGDYGKQLASVLLHARDWEAARRAVVAVIRTDPDDIGAIRLLAEIELQASQAAGDAR